MPKKFQQDYVVGSAARKYETAVPARPREREKTKKELKKQQRVNENVQKAKEFNMQYVAVLGFAMTLVVVFCINYLKVQSKIVTQRREIALLQQELTDLKEDNKINYKRVMGSVSLSEIFRIATQELGMVYPANGQVIYYDKVDPDYVKQYRDIPE